MVNRFISTIHQERRRLLFVIILSYIAGLLAHLHLDLFISGKPVAIFFASLQAVVVGIFVLLICSLVPSLRFMAEAFAVSRLVVAVLVFLFPDALYPLVNEPFLAASVVAAGGFWASRLIHGQFHQPRLTSVSTKISALVNRRPARLLAQPWQLSFVRWIDDAKPVAVSAI